MEVLSAAGVVEEFGEQWRRSSLSRKMPEPMIVANGLRVELMLIAVYERYQNQGLASHALQILTTLCDANRVAVELVARRLDPASLATFAPGCPAALSTEQLVSWYRKHGFVDATAPGDDTRKMIREPQ